MRSLAIFLLQTKFVDSGVCLGVLVGLGLSFLGLFLVGCLVGFLPTSGFSPFWFLAAGVFWCKGFAPSPS